MEGYTEELIAVGAAVCTNCQPCLKHHVDKARKKGASEVEIAAAVKVGGRIRDIAVRKTDGFASTLLTGRKTDPDTRLTDCGCG